MGSGTMRALEHLIVGGSCIDEWPERSSILALSFLPGLYQGHSSSTNKRQKAEQ